MLRFEINHNDDKGRIDEILIDVPLQKTYLSAPFEPKKQSRQKGGTCWYYVMNELRPRYGSGMHNSHPRRRDEMILSSYRKQKTKLDELKHTGKAITSSFDTKAGKNLIREKLETKKQFAKLVGEKYILPGEIELYKSFLNQNKYEYFDEFLKENILEQKTELAKSTLSRLGVNPISALGDYLSCHHPQLEIADITNDRLQIFYITILRIEAAKRYEMIASSWHVKDGIDTLIDTLSQNGACYIGGRFGHSYYSQKPTEQKDKFGKWKVYAWKPGQAISPKDHGSEHVILVIGAEKHRNKGYVYYLDPNDSKEDGKIYKISYERLCTNISNVYGQRSSVYGGANVKGPFAYHANIAKIDYLYEFHKYMHTYLQTDTVDANEEEFRQLKIADTVKEEEPKMSEIPKRNFDL